jgi:hypothetical protein
VGSTLTSAGLCTDVPSMFSFTGKPKPTALTTAWLEVLRGGTQKGGWLPMNGVQSEHIQVSTAVHRAVATVEREVWDCWPLAACMRAVQETGEGSFCRWKGQKVGEQLVLLLVLEAVGGNAGIGQVMKRLATA